MGVLVGFGGFGLYVVVRIRGVAYLHMGAAPLSSGFIVHLLVALGTLVLGCEWWHRGLFRLWVRV